MVSTMQSDQHTNQDVVAQSRLRRLHCRSQPVHHAFHWFSLVVGARLWLLVRWRAACLHFAVTVITVRSQASNEQSNSNDSPTHQPKHQPTGQKRRCYNNSDTIRFKKGSNSKTAQARRTKERTNEQTKERNDRIRNEEGTNKRRNDQTNERTNKRSKE